MSMVCLTDKKAIVKILAFILLLTLSNVNAEVGIELKMGYSGVRILDPGFDYISENNFHDELNISTAYRFYKDLWAIGEYLYSSEVGSDLISTGLVTYGALLGVRYTLSYIRRIQPFASAGGVYYWGRLHLKDEYSSIKKRDYTFGIAGEFGVAVVPFKRFDFFIEGALGYLLNPHFDNLRLNFGRFGALDMEGRRYRISAGVHF